MNTEASIQTAPTPATLAAERPPAVTRPVLTIVEAPALAVPELPRLASDSLSRDWDDLFDAVRERLSLSVADAPGGAGGWMRACVLQCVEALGQLHAGLQHERQRNLQIERERFHLRASLAQARVNLARSRADTKNALHRALHDELTLLPNRSMFGAWLDEALAPADPRRLGLAVFYLDLDRFKAVNDDFGHGVGDELLRTVAVRLSAAVRAEDVVSRLGGDEFACVLVSTPDREQLSHLADKLFDAVSAPMRIGSHDIVLHPSIGIAVYPQHGLNPEELLKSADAAMYYAKRLRCGHAFADDEGEA
jgi:diguanylate cyclase (GGDEF)-like protein